MLAITRLRARSHRLSACHLQRLSKVVVVLLLYDDDGCTALQQLTRRLTLVVRHSEECRDVGGGGKKRTDIAYDGVPRCHAPEKRLRRAKNNETSDEGITGSNESTLRA